MKTQTKISLVIIIILLIIISGIFFLNRFITGNVILEPDNSSKVYMYTKAICNDSNYCQDNEITCEGNQTISVTPITGAAVQHPEDWIDPRNESDKLC
jgi:hypothetical protein